ncbi:hypothetical protein EKL97_04640 [Flavobacterium sp. LS1P28]|uniref:Dihydrolipoamide dehydrogenase n=1 Tax=Flavobacterium bomense TaxID=2497483 RepID=A0A432CNH3_9FLAO|nr:MULTISPECIES: hypothetical protein [Flavobacterium]RTY65280.1 hypothetical protein EKL95_13200 [Flavobacterium sp. LB2P53]RTY74151.1 hypothetical protein EKL96_08770 [Flavobacterium sp. LS1R10]RTY83569.1 hypothetical protein EKL97_04640 [Flavobacterium sp. LS1P28]RTY83641.1 hypothetical protein EKL99_03390 [Flavobacterium sp. ZB4P23]RTZ05619.1 hypothetical protein EKL98_06765 [Flavobacterium bomense]
MKKITLFLVFIGMMTLQSCEVTELYDTVDNGPRTEVYEVTTSFNSNNNYSSLVVFDPPIYSSDSVLVYHLYDTVNGADIWKLMPQTYYLNNGGELDFNFDYSRFDVKIFLAANFNLNTLDSSWTQNQTFRIVIVPANFASTINKNNMDAVMSSLKVSKSEIQKINL